MLNLSPNRNNHINRMRVETIDLEINDKKTRFRLPRHISSLENKTYQRSDSIVTNKIPSTCTLNPDCHRAEVIDLAVDIAMYQLNDCLLQQKHLENLLVNLKHRIEVAKATGNTQLASILRQEFNELIA